MVSYDTIAPLLSLCLSQLLTYICVEALRNDDADDSEEESEEGRAANEEARIAKRLHRDETEAGKEKLPTGRVVGIVKRNWRTYVELIQ